jgi:SAM-dependent methyltransferase
LTASRPSPDPDSLRYRQHWEPVLAASARRTLERIETEPASVLDLGAGTGSLTLAAAARWPGARVVALDASGAMLDVARSRITQTGVEPDRFEWLVADAAHIPLDDRAVELVASSFLLQLPGDRPAVLREVRRVLRPGGSFSFVTWLADDLVLPADAAYHGLLGDIGDEDDDDGFRYPRSGDYGSLEQARDELVLAGLEVVAVVEDELRHAWTAESYLAFKVGYDDRERFDALDAARRQQLLVALGERLATLPSEAFEVRGPLVAAVARRALG